MPLRQQCTVGKLAVLLLQLKHEMREKGESLQSRIKECSEAYVQFASGFTAAECSKPVHTDVPFLLRMRLDCCIREQHPS